jgi:uncharacterized protein (TIGR02271 family)
MVAQEQISTLYNSDVYDRDGNKIGSVGQVWGDPAGQPSWISVKTGLFGLNESLVPLQDAELQSDRLVIPFDKSKVKDAPNVDASKDEPLEQDDVQRLYEYYGLGWGYGEGQAGTSSGTAGYSGTYADDAGAGTYADRTDTYAEGTSTGTYAEGDRTGTYAEGDRTGTYAEGDRTGTYGEGTRDDVRTTGTGTSGDAMTRSEERLNVGTQREQVGRARLRKYVVTEQQQVSVPVQHEEVRLEREPITEANRDSAVSGPDFTESEHEVTLHAERPVVETEAVPVERVRLGKETVTGEETVGGEVRKERVEAELPGEEGRRDLD